jgi:hypothetical protein
VAERARLLIECTFLKCTEGSNPSHSENLNFLIFELSKSASLTYLLKHLISFSNLVFQLPLYLGM